MKLSVTILLILILGWSQVADAKYCNRNPSNNLISCKFIDTNGRPHNATLTLTLTREGYSLMIAVFVDEWLMLGGESTATFENAEPVGLNYKGTRRDITEQGLLMEAAVFLVDKDFVQKMHQSKGMIAFDLAAEEKDDLVVEFWSKRFKKLDGFIDETQAILNPAK